MKRINNLFEKICTIDNVDLADSIARRRKSHFKSILEHDKNREFENILLSTELKLLTYKTSEYTTKTIYEPKERLIYMLPYYPDRIVHHAIMNILEPIWTKIFTKDTYACIKGRGITLLLTNLKNDIQRDRLGTTYCLKMDIKKFYPSITHSILKDIIRKKIKDKKLLFLLDEIIDSTDGVPIGNYLSQFFANLYLAYFDHWVKEELKAKHYYRYADDLVILSDSKELLRSFLVAIKLYMRHILNLLLKDNYLIFPVEKRGIDFVGYVIRHNYILIRKSIKKKMMEEGLHKKKLNSYLGWLKYCSSKMLLLIIEQETGIHFSNFVGERTSIRKMRNKTVRIVHVENRPKYFLIQFIYKGKPYYIKSHNKKLLNELDQNNF